MTTADTPDERRCSRCGTAYAGQASPMGLCPACLMALAAEESGIRSPEESGIGNQESGGFRQEESAVIQQPHSGPALRAHRWRYRWLAIPVALFVLAVGALLVTLVRRLDSSPAIQPLASAVRFTLPFPTDTRALDGAQFAPSPDGTTIVLAARAADGRSRLWIRRLQALDWQELSRTEGASYPFWSPDGRHVGFFAERRLKRIDVSNHVSQTVGDAPDGHGGTWGLDDWIVFAPTDTGPLQRVAASGGTPQRITRLDEARGEVAHVWPRFLADGVRLVYFANAADTKQKGSYLADLNQGTAALVVRRDVAVVPADDLLLFSHNGTLMAQRFDARRPQLDDRITAIAGADDVGGPMAYGPNFSASGTVLVYRNTGPRLGRLTWFDRRGQVIGEVGMPAEYQAPAVSPDGRRIVVARTDDRTNTSDIWVNDVDHRSTRLTFGPAQDSSPIWSPDGVRVAYASSRDGRVQIMTTKADGGGTEETIATWPQMVQPTDWSNDGRALLFTTRHAKTGLDVWAMPLAGDRKPWPLLQTPFDESDAHVSPDGRWVAYVSNESGLDQIYVCSFPEPESRFQISVTGGTHPRWRRDGRELIFVAPDGMLTAVDVMHDSTFRSGSPAPLLRLPDTAEFTMGPGGEQFLVLMPHDEASNSLHVILNWKTELAAR